MSKKTVLLAILFIITLVALGSILTSALNQLACEGQPINNNAAPTAEQQILGERVIGQSFVAPRNGLNRIDLFFLTYERQNKQDVTMRLLEISPEAENPFQGIERFGTVFNAATVQNRLWRNFTFPQINDSAGKQYLIVLQSPDSTDGNAITVGGIEQNSYTPGSAFLGAVPIPADMAFRTCYAMTTSEKLQILGEQITQDRPSIWRNPSFYLVTLFIYILLIAGLFWQLTKLVR